MNQMSPDPGEATLSALLRESRVAPSLPPRFQENVWKRIGRSEAPAVPKGASNWLEALAGCLLRPRFALAAAIVMIAAGSAFGVRDGNSLAQHQAQARYLAAVAPNSLR
jgi:hypothetical protein